MRVFAGKSLYGSRRTTVGVAFTQNRVNGTTENLGIAGLNFFLFVIFRVFFVFRNVVTLLVQLLDRGPQLGNGR